MAKNNPTSEPDGVIPTDDQAAKLMQQSEEDEGYSSGTTATDAATIGSIIQSRSIPCPRNGKYVFMVVP